MSTNDIKYTLNTQYGDNSKTLLKTPKSVSQTIYIGQAPTGGGDGGNGGDGNPDENPLG